MYEIYINENVLCLAQKQSKDSAEDFSLVVKYEGKPYKLLPYIDLAEKSKDNLRILIWTDDIEKLFSDFASLYRVIEAGGGVLENDGKIAMIHRLGYWDLPKGKLEKGESIEEAAVREVTEEIGIEQIQLEQFLMHSYHTYKDRKDRRVLKKTHWYFMTTSEWDFTLQTEEGIEKAEWVETKNILRKEPFYASLRPVLRKYLDFL